MSETLERFYSLDETIRDIKEAHELEIQSIKDKLMAAEIEATMLRAALEAAERERKASERLAVKLITQFAVVEMVFAEAKSLALSVHSTEEAIRAAVKPPANAL